MTTRDFCYWLQGYFEIEGSHAAVQGEVSLTVEQCKIVQKHLALVFAHDLDPKAGNAEVQQKLNQIHCDFGKDAAIRC